MTIYESPVTEGKNPCCPTNPCCEEECDEPSFWDLLPQYRLNCIAFGLAAFAIGFGLIGLGYLNIGTALISATNVPALFDAPTLDQGLRLIFIFLGVILISAWLLFRECSDKWKIVIVGSLIGASGFPLAAIGLVYFTVAQLKALPVPPAAPFDPTWFNIAVPIIIASIVVFLFLAYFTFFTRCHGCIDAKKGVIVSLIFLSAGWAAWSLGRLLDNAIITFAFSVGNANLPFPPGYVFPAAAYQAFIAVSVVNIVLVLALGWYILTCGTDNCFTIFLPLFASAASLGNWALYRVAWNVLSYLGRPGVFPVFPPSTPLIQFAVAIGSVSISALVMSFVNASCVDGVFATAAASAILILHAIATQSHVSTSLALQMAIPPDFVTSMLRGIFTGITLTAVLVFVLSFQAKCPIPRIIYGLAAGAFGWAVIYLYSTYSSNQLNPNFSPTILPNATTLNIGLNVIIGVAIIAVFFVRKFICDELIGAITLLLIALLMLGGAGLTGTIAYYQNGFAKILPTRPPDIILPPLNSVDINAAVATYIAYASIAIFLPRFFVKCGGAKRQLVIAIASLAFGVAAIDFGRAVVFARAVAFNLAGNGFPPDFSTMVYTASAFGVVLIGQVIVWAYPQANVHTALTAIATALIAGGISHHISFFVEGVAVGSIPVNSGLIGVPWLIFTLGIAAMLAFLEFKSLCIPQHCRFLIGLLIPVLGIAVFGKVTGASAAFGTAFNFGNSPVGLLFASTFNPRLMLVNVIIPLAGFIISSQAFKCTSCLSYLPSCIVYTGVVYVVSQFEVPDEFSMLTPVRTIRVPPIRLNVIATIYFLFDVTVSNSSILLDNAAFITQVTIVYIIFLAPALIAAFAFSCSKPVSSAVLGAAIATSAISFGAYGVANAIVGILEGISSLFTLISVSIPDNFITFAQFLTAIGTQFALLIVGVLIAFFIFFDKCSRC